MLSSLTIKNIALIDQAEIEFCKGLNILSGETGAGKSVILDSLNFVLGAKADKTMIRHGEQFCLVTCVFSNYPQSVKNILDEYDIEQSNEIVIKRKFDINGNGYIKLNGENVTATMLRKITSLLVDVHGQSEHFLLLSKSKQLECIDAGAKLEKDLNDLSCVLNELKDIESQLQTLGGDPEERFKRIDILEYQINEIQKAQLKEGEKEELNALKLKFLNLEKLYKHLQGAASAISDENGAIDCLFSAEQSLKGIIDLSEDYNQLYGRLSSVRNEIEDISESITNAVDALDSSDMNIDEIEQRLEVYYNFSRKYGNSVAEINEYLDKAINERDVLINFDKTCEDLLKKLKTKRENAYAICNNISKKRRLFATEFASKVTSKLAELGMPKAQFTVDFEDIPPLDEIKHFSNSGLDKIEFLFSANAGEPVKPLSKIISGGEMSRFMLALKTQLTVESETYIFDEIDTGISGITASIVAKQFAQISKNKQIIAISHLPQITAMSDKSLLITKHEEENKTYTQIESLSSEMKISEIIRLIGGNPNDSVAITHAKKMISDADEYKASI